jgi:hypothetical protein
MSLHLAHCKADMYCTLQLCTFFRPMPICRWLASNLIHERAVYMKKTQFSQDISLFCRNICNPFGQIRYFN